MLSPLFEEYASAKTIRTRYALLLCVRFTRCILCTMNRHDEQVFVCYQNVKFHFCLLGNNVKQPEKEATTKFLLFRNVKQGKKQDRHV